MWGILSNFVDGYMDSYRWIYLLTGIFIKDMMDLDKCHTWYLDC